jgi:16S rRNA (uracil1498-N3)-methyltransferase
LSSPPRFFLPVADFSSGKLILDRAAKKKLTRVLRLKEGDTVEIITPGKKWECVISALPAEGVEVQAVRELPAPGPSRCYLTLAQAIPKGDRFDWLIQKATELGIAEIYPLVTERTIVRPSNPDGRMQRWNEIAAQAAAQCEGAYPARVHKPLTLAEFLSIQMGGLKILLHERQGYLSLRRLLDHVKETRITFAVGPEGGWTPEETEAIVRSGYARVELGKRILRCDTAGLALAAILQYTCGDFSD